MGICPKCGNKDCLYKESELYWHEAVDRAHVACDHFFEYVENHPAIQHDDDLKKSAERVTIAMNDFYQLVSSRSNMFNPIEDMGGDDGKR